MDSPHNVFNEASGVEHSREDTLLMIEVEARRKSSIPSPYMPLGGSDIVENQTTTGRYWE